VEDGFEKNCTFCGDTFRVYARDIALYSKIGPSIGGHKYSLPKPSLCPNCRKQRRLCFRNERNLFARSCAACGKHILSVYPPDLPHTVYCQSCWLGDQWNAQDYGVPVDFGRGFYDSFAELLRRVPLRSVFVLNSENSIYTNLAGNNRSCYLLFNSHANEDCYYSRGLGYSQDCVDMLYATHNELCYECINVHNCYKLIFSRNCFRCQNSYFLHNCRGCADCFGSVNLVQKQYYFLNKACTKDEYTERMARVVWSYSAFNEMRQSFEKMVRSSIQRASQIFNSTDCTGDYLSNCQNCRECFETHDTVDSMYCDSIKGGQDICDAFGACVESELLCEVMAVGKSQNVAFATHCWNCWDAFYSMYCVGCDHIFACIGLKYKSYCIFNVQYDPEEYERLLGLLLEQMLSSSQWGEFFPVWLSPFGYNHSVASDYFPMEKAIALDAGFRWSDYRNPPPHVDRVFKARELPESIDGVDNDISSAAIVCEETGQLFRVVPQELAFYRRQGLPLPRRCPAQRHLDRLAVRNPHQLWQHCCDNCGTEITSSFNSQGAEQVYCEKCFSELVC
jgi:hypothetical protein